MSRRCQAKVGFFTLRDCNEPAARQCTKCHRKVCETHLKPLAGTQQCKECYARARELDHDDDDWVYGYRDRYYDRHSYSPIYFGHHHHHYYDTYDTRSFDASAGSAHDDGVLDDDAGDFYDS